MKIGELAAATGVTADTLRYYEKHLLLDPPGRAPNGYRLYNAKHMERVKFVRSAKALGFSLAQISAIIPRLSAGQFGRAEMEHELREKLVEVTSHIKELEALSGNLIATLSILMCETGVPISTAEATLVEPGKPMRVRNLQRKPRA